MSAWKQFLASDIIVNPFVVNKGFTFPSSQFATGSDGQLVGIDRFLGTNVNWFDAQDYVRWLSTQTGQTYRLLSEAEWEYACRAGTVTDYFWGDEIGQNNCNCEGSGSEWSAKSASPVNSFRPNAFGLYDMLGNAWEWVEDVWHEDYDGAPSDGTAWKYGGNRQWRVIRGGCWDSDPRDARAPLRLWIEPSIRNYGIGFRVARAL